MNYWDSFQSRLLNSDEKTKREAYAKIKSLIQQRDRELQQQKNGLSVSPFCPQKPFPKQELFLKCKHREAFFGGSAGPGKSSALLMAALQYVDVPGYSAILFRRTYADLAKPGALMYRAHEWLTGSGAKWSERDKQWTFPSGAVLSFGYLETANDKFNYQGAEYQFVGFDEISQFEEESYTYLFTRLRKLKNSEIPLRMRAASNPGGVGADWVKERFIPENFTPDDAIEVKVWEKKGQDGETRAFVPARLADNGALDQEEYRKSFLNVDEVTRRQLLLGDWAVKQKGNIFPEWSEEHHVITWEQFREVFGASSIPPGWALAIGHDFGTTKGHPAVISCIATSSENSKIPGLHFIVWSRTMVDITPDDVGEMIERTLTEYELDPDQVQLWRMSHEASSPRKVYREKFNLPFISGKHGKTDGIAQMSHFLRVHEKPHYFKKISGCPKLFYIVDSNQLVYPKDDRGLKRLREEMAEYRWGETNPTEARGQGVPVPKKWRDDAIDSLRFIFAEWGPGIEPFTPDEKREMALHPDYRLNYLDTLTGNQRDFYFTLRDHNLAEYDKEIKEKEATVWDRFFHKTV